MPKTVVVRRWPTPTRNNVQLQFSSIDLGLRGVYFPWVSEISYTQTLEPGDARGTSPYTMGYTLGELKANGSITVQRIYRERFIQIVEQGSAGFMDKLFPIQVQYQEVGWDSVETDELEGCRIQESGHDYQAGSGVLMTKFPLIVSFVKLNGHIPLAGISL